MSGSEQEDFGRCLSSTVSEFTVETTSEIMKSSCVEKDRAQAQGSLEPCLVMWRGLEQHTGVDASWQVADSCFLRGSSQRTGGEQAGGKVTQVWG